MERILVSACLLGARVRYHGGDASCVHPALRRWTEEGRLLPVCPEVDGGLSVPRPAAEIVGPEGARGVIEGRSIVRAQGGQDVSEAFLAGAKIALETARRYAVKLAILKDGSPSCGRTYIYDGTFSGQRTAGMGVTAALLEEHGIRVFSDTEIEAAAAWLEQLESHDGN